jgi:hypothetical protein
MLVMLVKNDGETTPPLGSVGEIVGVEADDLLVEFARYPCPAGPETAWLCPEHWLIPLEDPSNRFIFIANPEPQTILFHASSLNW